MPTPIKPLLKQEIKCIHETDELSTIECKTSLEMQQSPASSHCFSENSEIHTKFMYFYNTLKKVPSLLPFYFNLDMPKESNTAF